MCHQKLSEVNLTFPRNHTTEVLTYSDSIGGPLPKIGRHLQLGNALNLLTFTLQLQTLTG